MRLRLAKSYVLGLICPQRGVAGDFLNFPMLLQLVVNVNRNMALQRKEMEIATFLPIAAGKRS
jgi:hypothetical protein